MNKLRIVFGAVIVFLLFFIYVFIPNYIHLKAGIGIKATGNALYRVLLDTSQVSSWWPGEITGGRCYLNDDIYTIRNGNITVLPVFIESQNREIKTSLFLITIVTDSTRLEWVGSLKTSINPFKRISEYLEGKKINSNMNSILEKIQIFYSNPVNIYGFDIVKTLVIDSLLISTEGVSKGYPSNDFIYNLIEKLRKYAIVKSAKESGYPMLNVRTDDSVNYEVKVAIPTNKILESFGDIVQKRMPGRSIILMTNVVGGIGINNQAFDQIQKFAIDHQLKAPAIPFYSLVTERTKEPDTSKWKTSIFFPVMIYPE